MKIFTIILLFFMKNTEAAQVLNWEECVKLAAETNSELIAAKHTLDSSLYQEKGAKSGFFPQISASSTYSYVSTSSNSASSLSGGPNSLTTSLDAKENLFSGFSDVAKIDQAKYAKFSSAASLDSTKAKVSNDLKIAFSGLSFAQKYITLTEDIIKRREANLRLVQLRFESGRENIGSLNLSKAYLAQAKYEHLQAMNSLQVYQSQLAQVLGVEESSELNVNGDIPLNTPPAETTSKMDFKNLAKTIPESKKAQFNELSAMATLDLSKSSFYPSLNLTQSIDSYDHQSKLSHGWSLGATITLPLFEGGKDYYAYKSSSENYRSAAMTRKNTEEVSLTKLKNAYTNYIEGVMKLEVDQAFVVASESRERIAKAQYNNGLISFIDWDNIENDLIVRQKSLLQTQKDRVSAEAGWELVAGLGVIQ